MSRTTNVKAAAMMLAVGCLIVLAEGVGGQVNQEQDAFRAGSVWKGEIRQGQETFPTTIYVYERNMGRVRGEVHFRTSDGLCKLVFQGNIVKGRTIAWITDKKEGNVTFPGLYIASIKGKTLSGTWQVPSADQYDSFSVKLAE